MEGVTKEGAKEDIWGMKEEEARLEKLHNGGRHELYSSAGIINMIKPRMPRRKEHVTRIAREKCTAFWWEMVGEGDHLTGLHVDGGY